MESSKSDDVCSQRSGEIVSQNQPRRHRTQRRFHSENPTLSLHSHRKPPSPVCENELSGRNSAFPFWQVASCTAFPPASSAGSIFLVKAKLEQLGIPNNKKPVLHTKLRSDCSSCARLHISCCVNATRQSVPCKSSTRPRRGPGVQLPASQLRVDATSGRVRCHATVVNNSNNGSALRRDANVQITDAACVTCSVFHCSFQNTREHYSQTS